MSRSRRPASMPPLNGGFSVYRKTSYTPFSATIEGAFLEESAAIQLAKDLAAKMTGRFEVVNPSGYTVQISTGVWALGEIRPAAPAAPVDVEKRIADLKEFGYSPDDEGFPNPDVEWLVAELERAREALKTIENLSIESITPEPSWLLARCREGLRR